MHGEVHVSVHMCTKNYLTCAKCEVLNRVQKHVIRHTKKCVSSFLILVALSILNPYIFSKIKESLCGWVMNLGNEYQNFFIFIALLIADNEGWTANL